MRILILLVLLVSIAVGTLYVWVNHTNQRVDRVEESNDRIAAENRRLRRANLLTRRRLCRVADQVGYDGTPIRC